LKENITQNIRTINQINYDINSDRIETGRNNITKMTFGYNDIFWIMAVVLWTTGVTAVILLIMKRRVRTNSKLD
jgi:hypothetical protein